MDNNLPSTRKEFNFPSLRGYFWENWDSLWDDLDGLWMDKWFDMPTRRSMSFLSVKEDQYELRYELPGVDASEISVDRQGNKLTVKAEQKNHTTRSYFNFEKTVTLPEDAKTDDIKADLKAGILTLTISRIKPEEKKEESVKIEVKS